MTIRSDNDPKFYFRFKLIGLGALAFALWCIYDGYVTYPRERERGLAFKELFEEDRLDEWDEYARERGWSTESPGELVTETDIKMQYAMAALTALIGFAALAAVFRSRNRWIEADENGISSSWGQSLTYDQVETLEKRQWRSKGIAKVRYRDNGRRKTFVIDDFKFQREPTDEILELLESKIDVDKITGGLPEGVAKEPTAEAVEATTNSAETSQ